MTNKYVIEHDFAYGWDLLNDEEVDAYDSRAEAQEAINDMIAMTEEAFKKGDMDEAYDPEDYRVKKVRVSLPISSRSYVFEPDRKNDPDYSETDRKVDDLLRKDLKTFDYKGEDIFTDVAIVVANTLHKCGGSWTLEIHPDLTERFEELLDDNERAFRND